MTKQYKNMSAMLFQDVTPTTIRPEKWNESM